MKLLGIDVPIDAVNKSDNVKVSMLIITLESETVFESRNNNGPHEPHKNL